MENSPIILQFDIQSYAQNFRMLCLGVSCVSRGQITVRQLVNLIQTVNSMYWHAIPGRWIKIIEMATTYELDTTGWTENQLSEMTITKIESETGPKKWELKLDCPKELTSVRNDKTNSIDHPSHYISGRFEVIDIIEEFCSSLNGRAAFDNGNSIKYILRWQRKNGVEDLKKAIWYIQDLIKQVESEEEHNETTTDN